MHSSCLNQASLAHIWGDGTKLKAGRLSNVNNKAWKAFKDRCQKAYKAQQRERGDARQNQVPGPAKKRAKATRLTETTKSKKASKKPVRKGRAGAPCGN